MRSCIYCGRELKAGEVCMCGASVKHREQKQNDEKNAKIAKESKQTENKHTNAYRTSYKTGYAGEEKSRPRRARAKSGSARSSLGNMFKNLWSYVREFIKSPVDKIASPGDLGKAAILAIAAIQGAALWLCMFFVLRGGGVGPFKIVASLLHFNGTEGYTTLAGMGISVLTGAVSGVILFFLYSGIFYFINRFIFRLQTAYWDFCVRISSTWIPFTVICVIGALMSVLSPVTLMILLLCGAVSAVVLTYEALRTEWITKSPGKVMYAMMLGYFIFFSLLCFLLTI